MLSTDPIGMSVLLEMVCGRNEIVEVAWDAWEQPLGGAKFAQDLEPAPRDGERAGTAHFELRSSGGFGNAGRHQRLDTLFRVVGKPLTTCCEGGEIRAERLTNLCIPAFQRHDDEARVGRIEILDCCRPAHPDLGGCTSDERGEQRDVTLAGGKRGEALVDPAGSEDLHALRRDAERLDDGDKRYTESAGR